MGRQDRISSGIEKAMKTRGLSFGWAKPLSETLGTESSAIRFAKTIISEYNAVPLDAPFKPNLDGIPNGRIQTPLDLMIYVINNRLYEFTSL